HAASVRPEPGSNSPLKNNTHQPKGQREKEMPDKETLTKKIKPKSDQPESLSKKSTNHNQPKSAIVDGA
ncbi:hypothetical protein, partial [Nocardioides insulae]|uniref:hypothetical protein n=1 Tax=Nocardioides insulae TaxID=394734 RepID=UPI001B7FDE01